MALFQQANRDTTDLTTYTFTAEPLGAADSARYIIVTIGSRGAAARTINSVTIGGVTATVITQPQNSPHTVGIAIAAVPTGTTGDIVIVFSGAEQRCGISTYRAIGINPTPTDTKTSTAANPAATLNVPANGIAIGVAMTLQTGAPVCTWTGLTEDVDETIESITVSTASLETVSALPTLSVIADFTAGTLPVGAFVSWGPAASTARIWQLSPTGDSTAQIAGNIHEICTT